MDDFQAQVDGGKTDALAPFLDTDALKKNVVEFLKLRFNSSNNPASNLTPEQMQATADSFVTRDNILLMMKGAYMEPGTTVPTATDDKTPHPVEKHYETPGVYAVDIYKSQVETPDNKLSLLFVRDGWFGWKLSAFRFSWSG